MAFQGDKSIKSSFRNVEFLTTSATTSGGRKVNIKSSIADANAAQENMFKGQYKDKSKNKPVNKVTNPINAFTTSDIGFEVQTFKITAIFYGSEYKSERDALIKALDNGTPGELFTPTLGTYTVLAQKWNSFYSSTEFEYEKINMEFVLYVKDAGKKSTDTDVKTTIKADATINQTQTTASNNSDTIANNNAPIKNTAANDITANAGFMKSAVSSGKFAAKFVGNTYEEALDAIDFIASDVDELVGDIALLFSNVNNSVELIANGFESRLDAYNSLIDMGKRLKNKISSYTSGSKESNNEILIDTLFRSSIISNAAKQLDFFNFGSVTDINKTKDEILDQFDSIIEKAADLNDFAETYQLLVELKAIVYKALSQKLLALPNLKTITIKDPVPAEVLAYQLYGDATRAIEIIERNKIVNSLFVQGEITILGE